MSYILGPREDYPGPSNLPVYKVYDFAEYNNPAIKNPRAIGEVWAIGVPGVSGQYVPTGVRYQRTGSFDESPVFPIGAFGDAARAMIKELRT